MNSHPEIIIVPAVFILIGFTVWVTVTAWQRSHRLKLVAEFNSRLLDRMGSLKDFNEFVQSAAGVQFMKGLTAEPPSGGASDRIIRAVQSGIVLLSVGGGLLLTGRSPSLEGYEAFNNLGVIALSLGVGFILSSGASLWLASWLGVLRPSPDRIPPA